MHANAGIGVYGPQLDVPHLFDLNGVLITILTGKAHSDGTIESLTKGLFTVMLSRLKEITKSG